MSRTVTEILATQHGIGARPGMKVECPFCHHTTFSIKKDDSLGRCFHPTCGRYVTPFSGDPGPANALYAVLEKVGHDFHHALLDLADKPGRHAYSYCVHERGIHPRVLIDFPLGVIPTGYDATPRFAPLIAEAQAQLQRAQEAKDRTKISKARIESAQRGFNQLTDASAKLAKLLQQSPGWLAFVYTDSAQRVVAFRFRRPHSKSFQSFKPTSIGGCFGHGVFSADGSPRSIIASDPLLVLEGEFNVLQLQTLCARHSEANGRAPEGGYVFACAVGGVHNADPETLRRLCRNPVVCYDKDADGAGFALVESLRRHTTIAAFTTPGTDTDLDSYIREFGEDHAAALKAICALVAARTVFTRPYDALKSEIDGLRMAEGGRGGIKQFQVQRLTSEIVITDLKDRSMFYNDGTRGFLFNAEEKHLIAIEADELAFELLLAHYGLAPGEEIFRYVRDAMRLEALEHGTKTTVYALSHFDAASQTLYLSDLDHGIYRIRPDGIEFVDIGTDGVLFIYNADLKAFKIGEADRKCSALDDLIFGATRFREDVLGTEEQRIVLMLWFYALFFPEIFPTRPLLALIGERGSGKSSLLRRMGRLLFGASFDVMELTDDPKDFDAAITNSQFVVVDNADKMLPWLEDKLAVASTGGRIQKRELYTTNRLVGYRILAFIAITSRTPYFRREDVADRTLLLQVPRLERFLPEASLLAELDARRNEAMTEVVGHLQEIVQALHDQHGQTYDTTFRMADFANFALKIFHAQGRAGVMEQILTRMAQEQTAFALEGEQIVELLEVWLAEGDGRNVGRPVTTADLHREFGPLAQKLGIELKFKNALSIAQTIRFKGSALRELFEITEHKGSGRSRRLSFRLRTSSAMAADSTEEEHVHAR